jgi:hypothetical protein
MTVQRVLDQLQGWSYQANAAIRQPSEVRMNWMVLVPPPSNSSPSKIPDLRYSLNRDAISPAISVRSETSHSVQAFAALRADLLGVHRCRL